MPQMPRQRTGMPVFSHAARTSKTLAAANAGDHGGRQALGYQPGPLLDVQLQIRSDIRGIEQTASFRYCGRIKTAGGQSFLQRATVVGAPYRQACRIQQPEGALTTEIGNIEPR